MILPENLRLRSITAIIFGLLMISALLLSRWAFAGLMIIVVVAGQIEFYRMALGKGRIIGTLTGLLSGAALYFLIVYYHFTGFNPEYFWLIVLIPVIIILGELFQNNENPLLRLSYTLTGAIYLAIPLALLVSLYSFEEKFGFSDQGMLVLGFFVVLWVFDSAAYIVGSMFGKHKLFERISPKKSWEGILGGLFFGMLTAYILSSVFSQIPVSFWIGFSLLIMIFGTLGDLAESMMKRSMQLKDSGNLLPGHGGLLDRFDAVLLSAPFIYIFTRFFGTI